MSRRTQAPKRIILPDPKYKSELLAKFMNMIMNDGKKFGRQSALSTVPWIVFLTAKHSQAIKRSSCSKQHSKT